MSISPLMNHSIPDDDGRQQRDAFRRLLFRLRIIKPTIAILSSYFTSRPDPQASTMIPADSEDRLGGWVSDVSRQGLSAWVFHDGLSERFCAAVSSNAKSVGFVKCPPPDMSPNDYRFFMYARWLRTHRADFVFCTDLFDVRINTSVHRFVLSHPSRLWLSIENDWTIDDSTPHGTWVMNLLNDAYGNVPEEVQGQPILNAGVWGGEYGAVRELLQRVTGEMCTILSRHHDINCNMAAFNRVIRRDYAPDEYWSRGAPFHSRFKQYEHDARVCFVHK